MKKTTTKPEFLLAQVITNIKIDVCVKDAPQTINTFRLDCDKKIIDISLFHEHLKQMTVGAIKGYGALFLEIAEHIEKNNLFNS